MPRRHRRERRRRIGASLATAALVLVAAACSSSGGSDSSTTTTAPKSTTSTVPTTSTTAAPTISSTPVTDTGGTRVGIITAVDGTGPATIALPTSALPTAIVHAQFTGAGAFIVSGVNAAGHDTEVLAQSVGAYDGSFPVGFADPVANPTTGLRIDTTGRWHLDITEAKFAPELSGGGVSGHGDAVLSYRGPATTAHVIYAAPSPFAVSVFANGAITRLASAVGPYDKNIALPAGPAFISVTADGDWSMSLG